MRVEATHLVAVARLHFPRWYAWVLLTLRTGLRLGEQMALQWGDIDWHGQFIVVQRNVVRGVLTTPKSHQCRRVDMSPQLTIALAEWRRVQQARWLKKGKDMPLWVFPARQGGYSRSAMCATSSRACWRRRPCGTCAFTTCGTRSRRCCCSRGRASSREGAARTRQHPDHRRHARTLDSWRESRPPSIASMMTMRRNHLQPSVTWGIRRGPRRIRSGCFVGGKW